jgi:3-isopropylmalate dehydrogenase
MPTHNLLLIPGDGIGPEVMAEVKKLIAWMNAHRMGTFTTEEGLCGGCAYDAHGVAITDEMVAKAKGRRRRDLRLGRRAEMGQGAV